MMTYLLQMTICSLLLLGVYYFFLEKETMHRFKRFYLLFSLMLSITIPFISIEISGNSALISRLPFTEIQITTNNVKFTNEKAIALEETSKSNSQNILIAGYIAIAGILLSRFLINIARLIIVIKKNKHVVLGNMRIVLTDTESVPHSFGNYIFLNKNEYKTGLIEEEVLTHEMTHARQYHSLDILVIELLLILFWFNPILYLYKNRIKLNHEFLADEGVISAYNDVPHYQMILIDKISRQNSLSLTSNFNYLLTKKRLTMMTRKTSTRIAVMKRVVILPLFLLFAFAFCTKKVSEQAADNGKDSDSVIVQNRAESTQDTISRKTTNEDSSRIEMVHFTPPKIVKDGEVKQKKTVVFVPPVVVKDKAQAPPPPPIKVEKEETVKFTLDLSSYKVGDKYIDSDGHEWIVESVDPPKLKTSPAKTN
ncbi:MAG: M56 family metallopeptidase [Dysgonomonas sp.]